MEFNRTEVVQHAASGGATGVRENSVAAIAAATKQLFLAM